MPVREDTVREQIMQVGGRQLRVAIRPGTGTGPPLLLCNGVGMRLEALRPFVDALDPAIEVIRFDPPGTGGSQLPNRPYRFTTLALLLREMLHNLGHQQADVPILLDRLRQRARRSRPPRWHQVAAPSRIRTCAHGSGGGRPPIRPAAPVTSRSGAWSAGTSLFVPGQLAM